MAGLFEIAKDGFDVLTTADKNKIYSSKYQTFKAELEATVDDTITAGDTEEVLTVTHNLGYYPVVFAWITHAGQTHEICGFRAIDFPSGGEIQATWLHINTNQIEFYIFPPGASPTMPNTKTYTWTYKIMKDEF